MPIRDDMRDAPRNLARLDAARGSLPARAWCSPEAPPEIDAGSTPAPIRRFALLPERAPDCVGRSVEPPADAAVPVHDGRRPHRQATPPEGSVLIDVAAHQRGHSARA